MHAGFDVWVMKADGRQCLMMESNNKRPVNAFVSVKKWLYGQKHWADSEYGATEGKQSVSVQYVSHAHSKKASD